MLDFPANPNPGDTYQGWTWDGVKWTSTPGSGGGGAFLPLTGGTLTGNLAIVGAQPTLTLNKAASGDNNLIIAQTNGGLRWSMNLGDGGPEMGGNAGSDFSLLPASDTGVGIAMALQFNRATALGTIAGDPVAPLGIATKQYVDSARYGDNRIINGDCRIDQRNAGASLANSAGNVFPVDRWIANGSAANAFTVGRNLNAVAGPPGFPYYVGVRSSSAYAIVANSAFALQHRIEADQVGDLRQGTANAQPFTVSFWVSSSLTGTFSGALDNSNAGTNRNYLFTYSIPVANAWTKIVLAIPGDATGGGWTTTGNLTGLRLLFDLGSGATYRGTAGAWGPASAYPMNGVTGAVSVVAVNGATFYLTGVKLEIGSVATPYNRQSLAKSLADCQRYYYQGEPPLRGVVLTPTSVGRLGARHPVTMRAAPSLTITSPLLIFDGTGNTTVSSIGSDYASVDVLEFDAPTDAALTTDRPAIVYQGGGNIQVNAEL